MKVIPDTAYDNHSFAEQQVFEALKAFEADSPCVAFHSVMLPNHSYKRVGEADFVIVGRFGIFVLEVKGGAISHQNGNWTTANKNGVYQISNPFKQANSALHALNENILNFVSLEKTRLPLGYGVIFPDVVWSSDVAEWDSEIVCDAHKMKRFSDWLTDFFNYWHDRPANANLLSNQEVQSIVDFLRPNFELIPPLFAQIDQVKNLSVKLTQEQFHYVDLAQENKRVICSGGAGTGKTFLAIELCRRFVSQGKKVLLTCQSSWLRHYLSTLIASENLTISTVSGLVMTMKRQKIKSFDVLIVDEGQDILNMTDLKKLDATLKGGFDNGQWYFFHDVNNQANTLTQVDSQAIEWLKSKNNPSIFKLGLNCRNTRSILAKIQSSLGCDVGRPALIEGPEVTEFFGNQDALSIELSQLIKNLKQSAVSMGAISILSAVKKQESLLSLLSLEETKDIIDLDDYKVRTYPFLDINFAEIPHFKGLENDIIILIDLKNPKQLAVGDKKNLHYIGMSRARTKLYCFWTEH